MTLTANDLSQITAIVRDVTTNMATKADLESVATKVDLDRFATKGDLKRFATKADFETLSVKLDHRETRLLDSINLLQRDTFDRLDDHERRLANLEHRHST